MRGLSAIIIAMIAVIFCNNVTDLPPIGDPKSPPNQHVTPYYIQNGLKDTGSPNIVTGVLADYRGFDTLWETSVMFVAGIAGVMILNDGRTEKIKNDQRRLRSDEKTD